MWGNRVGMWGTIWFPSNREKWGTGKSLMDKEGNCVFRFQAKIPCDLGYYLWLVNVCEIAGCVRRFLFIYYTFSLYLKNETKKIMCSVLPLPIAGWRPGVLFNQYQLQFYYLYQCLLYWFHRIVWLTNNMLSLMLWKCYVLYRIIRIVKEKFADMFLQIWMQAGTQGL